MMEQIIEADANGVIVLSPEIGAAIKPHARYVLEKENGDLRLKLKSKEEEKPFWMTATPEERAEDFRKWVASHTDGPNLPNEAFRRESIYEDD
ncbi:MAG: hypothetical protein JNM09_06535 [Blastocatellia bacterium]|nr:hypothetical protein [Blastocatellia bacterium]